MKKYIFGLLICVLIFSPEMLMAGEIKIISGVKRFIVPPSIAENGKSFVYVAETSETSEPTVFVSTISKNGDFSRPLPVFDSSIKPKGLDASFKPFIPITAQDKTTGFNSPTVQDGVITFFAVLKDTRQGVFYARQLAGKWQVFPIVLQGQQAPSIKGKTISSLNSPYITSNSQAIFLATLDDKTDVVYSYKIPDMSDGDSAAKPAILYKTGNKSHDFYDISVEDATFATRAEDDAGVLGMYIFNRARKKLVKTVPPQYKVIDKWPPVILDGPSYYAGKLAFEVYSKNKDKDISGIFTNAGGNNYSVPIVHSSKKYKSLETTFYFRTRNPTLFIEDGRAFIAFMSFPSKQKDITGVYLAEIKQGKVRLKKVAVPGQKHANNMEIKSAEIGAVSIRDRIIPMTLTMTNGRKYIAVTKVE